MTLKTYPLSASALLVSARIISVPTAPTIPDGVTQTSEQADASQ